ncbi:MAG: CDP-glycerol glycerophosphotransferase family protein [Anaerovoracaceae bacterium]
MKIKKILYYGFQVLINRFLMIIPVKDKQVLFLSDVRNTLTGNFEFIYKGLDDSYKKVTSLKSDRRERHTFCSWITQCYYLATSKYILLDDYSEATTFIHIRKNQELIQLWHSSGAYKKFAHSRSGENGDMPRIHPGYKRYTKCITSSKHINHCFAEAFAIDISKVYATGIPRTDVFYNYDYVNNTKREFYKEHPELLNKKIVLYAPTYRGTKVSDANYDFGMLDLDYLYRQLGDDYVILIKWHPALYNNIEYGYASGIDIKPYEGFVYDFSQYREINDLLFVTDILVTDYSSLIFDYALLEKPIIYYAYDLKDYENGRGMYYDFKKYIYGDVVTNIVELTSSITNPNLCHEQRKEFIREFVAANDGKATQRTIETLFN